MTTTPGDIQLIKKIFLRYKGYLRSTELKAEGLSIEALRPLEKEELVIKLRQNLYK